MQIITICWIVASVCSLILLEAKDAAEISVEDPTANDPALEDSPKEESALHDYQKLDSLYLDHLQYAVLLIEGKLKYIKSMREKYFVGESMLKLDPYRYTIDVIQYFKLMKRFIYEWKEIYEIVTFDQLEELQKDFQEQFDKYDSLSMRDFRTVVENYLEIQQQSQVSIKDFADSNYPGAKNRTKLSGTDCYTVASHLIYDPAKQSIALEWLREALARYGANELLSIRFGRIVLELAYILSETGQIKEAIKLLQKYMTSSMKNDYTYVDMITYLKAKLAGRPVYNLRYRDPTNATSLTYWIYPNNHDWLLKEVCSQSSTLPKSYEAKLKCRYSTNGSPLFILSPLKEEELYLEPKISIYRQFLTNGEVDGIVEASMGKMKEAFVRTPTGFGSLRMARDSQTYDMDHRHPGMERVEERTDAMTGLTGFGAEQLQISYYKAAGFFAAHDDPFDSNMELPFGNRITTVLYYLNDVRVGGETAFYYLNVLAKPEKGSALVWDNLRRNGLINLLSGHGACPVIFGHKYIATRWYHHKPQVFLRPCTLKKTD